MNALKHKKLLSAYQIATHNHTTVLPSYQILPFYNGFSLKISHPKYSMPFNGITSPQSKKVFFLHDFCLIISSLMLDPLNHCYFTLLCYVASILTIKGKAVSFPDPAFTKDKGMAHFARNPRLPEKSSHVIINIFTIVGGVWSWSGEVRCVADTAPALLQSG